MTEAPINEKEFELMKEEALKFDSQRELLIKKSRDVLKLSKQVIYAVHRNDLKDAEKLSKDMRKDLDELNEYIKKNPKMYHQGSYKVSIQEYVEAMLFYGYVKENRLYTRKELNVDTDYYLLGVADLSGELVRKAILDATQKNYDSAIKIKGVVSDIYTLLLQFDIREGELRKKFDGIKYDLRKLEDLCFQLSLK
jgi:predicted translin family RNA/ssDNA-binding protein